jgi:hypothetical protein
VENWRKGRAGPSVRHRGAPRIPRSFIDAYPNCVLGHVTADTVEDFLLENAAIEKGKNMKPDLSQIAVMNIVEGEEIFGGWATPHIPQVGIYKLLAKKKVDGTIEWAHFVQRDNGLKERVIRGMVKTPAELDIVTDTANNNLRRIFGVTMLAAAFDVSTLDGEKASGTIH